MVIFVFLQAGVSVAVRRSARALERVRAKKSARSTRARPAHVHSYNDKEKGISGNFALEREEASSESDFVRKIDHQPALKRRENSNWAYKERFETNSPRSSNSAGKSCCLVGLLKMGKKVGIVGREMFFVGHQNSTFSASCTLRISFHSKIFVGRGSSRPSIARWFSFLSLIILFFFFLFDLEAMKIYIFTFFVWLKNQNIIEWLGQKHWRALCVKCENQIFTHIIHDLTWISL